MGVPVSRRSGTRAVPWKPRTSHMPALVLAARMCDEPANRMTGSQSQPNIQLYRYLMKILLMRFQTIRFYCLAPRMAHRFSPRQLRRICHTSFSSKVSSLSGAKTNSRFSSLLIKPSASIGQLSANIISQRPPLRKLQHTRPLHSGYTWGGLAG